MSNLTSRCPHHQLALVDTNIPSTSPAIHAKEAFIYGLIIKSLAKTALILRYKKTSTAALCIYVYNARVHIYCMHAAIDMYYPIGYGDVDAGLALL